MDDTDLAWIAGYLEGEGCFHLFKCNNKRFGLYRYPRVVCVSTDRDVIERLQRSSEVGRITGPRQRGTDKPTWWWTVSKSRDAVELMEVIHPYMGHRRQAKIDEIVDAVGRSKSPPARGRPLDKRAWVAGYLEGEGGFYWTTFHKGKYGPYHYPRVGACSTDEDVIARLPRYSGVGQVSGPYPRKPPQKTVWNWTVTNRRAAVTLMEDLYPSMGERRRAKIDEVLSFVGRERQRRLLQPRVIRPRDVLQGEDGGLPLAPRRTA